MSDNNDDDLKYGINWSFLKSLLEMYEQMLSDQHALIKSVSGCGVNPKAAYANMVASVHTFYTAIKPQYDTYLMTKDNQEIVPKDFIDIIGTLKASKNDQTWGKLISLSVSLSEWATSEGCFKTLTQREDPNAVW